MNQRPSPNYFDSLDAAVDFLLVAARRPAARRRAARPRQAASTAQCAVRACEGRAISRTAPVHRAVAGSARRRQGAGSALPGAVRAAPFRRRLPAPGLRAGAEARRAAGAHRGRGVLPAVGRAAGFAAGAAALRQPQLHPRGARAGRPRRQRDRAEGRARQRADGTPAVAVVQYRPDLRRGRCDRRARTAAAAAGRRDRSGTAVAGRQRPRSMPASSMPWSRRPGRIRSCSRLPRQPVSDADYAIGFYASALVRDGGTLQIGIGALADALCHALVLRHTDNAAYRRVLAGAGPGSSNRIRAVLASGGLEPFAQGLYGCSEMINEGFKRLVEAGVIRRKVVDDEALMQRDRRRRGQRRRPRAAANATASSCTARSTSARRSSTTGCATLPDDERRGIGMRRVSEVNELYGGNEALERLQRRDARFFNTCMMATALGAAVSDGLEDGRVVSGVGGQYNFVAMAHALPRCALGADAARHARGAGHGVVEHRLELRPHDDPAPPARHLHQRVRHRRPARRAATRTACIAMAGDRRCALPAGVARRPRERTASCAATSRAPTHGSRNTPQRLRRALAPFRARRHPARLSAGQRLHRGRAAPGEGAGLAEGEHRHPRRQAADGVRAHCPDARHRCARR